MSRAKTLSLGIALWTFVGLATDAGANPFSGGDWVWTSYGTGTGPDVVTNASSLGTPFAASTSATTSSGDLPAFAPGQMVTNASSSTPFSSSGSSATGGVASQQAAADGYINFGAGPYPDASTLTTGGGEAWYLSPTVQHAFGGVPNASQQSDFANQVLKDVQQTFALSGLSPNLTTDPGAAANHTISVVSNTGYGATPDAIGVANVGGNGFNFIDKLTGAQSVSDLEWAVAHNIAHELMHAFGVDVHHDQTGTYLDAATASWSLLTDPNTTFSPAAVQDILSHNFGRGATSSGTGAELIDGDQQIAAAPVPEPSTIVGWLAAGAGAWAIRRRRRAAA